jgi:hypothetical protein
VGVWGGSFLLKIHLVCPCCQLGLVLAEAEQLTTVHTRTMGSYLCFSGQIRCLSEFLSALHSVLKFSDEFSISRDIIQMTA